MTNKFIGFLEAVGRDFKKGLDFALPWLAGAGELAVQMFLPAAGPLFNQTVNAIVTAEQSAAAAGKQAKTGTQKLAAVLQIMGPLIAQGLADAGKQADETAVQGYINAVVMILNLAPAPATTTGA